MDFRNSFRSHSSYKQITRSPGDQSKASPEHRPILHDHHDHHNPDRLGMVSDNPKTESSRSSLDDGCNAPVERDSSYKFWQDNTAGTTSDQTSVKDPMAINWKSNRLSGSFDFAQGKPPSLEESPVRMVGEPMNRTWGGGGGGGRNEEITVDVDDDVQTTPTSTARTSFDGSRELRVSFNVHGVAVLAQSSLDDDND